MSMLKVNFTYICFLFVLSFSELKAATFTGCAAIWSQGQPISIEVPIELTNPNGFGNGQVTFTNTPENLRPNEGKYPWCFSVNDDRFAYVHTLYYVTEVIRWFNRLAINLGIFPLQRLTIDLRKAEDGTMPGGAANNGNIALQFSIPALDPTLIAHEVGHGLHDHLAGRLLSQLVNESLEKRQWRQAIEQRGVLEGTANLISALFNHHSQIGAFSYFDATMEIDKFVSFPNLFPTVEYELRRFIEAPIFRNSYPKSAQSMEDFLKNPSPLFKETLLLPDPYLASAIINQPLWKAAMRFGFQRVELLYFTALKGFVEFQSYAHLARQIEKVAARDPFLQIFLQSEFRKRGL